MAKKQLSFAKKFAIVGAALILVQLVIIFVYSSEKAPDSFSKAMHKKVSANSQIPPERRAQIKIQLALSDYKVKHKKFPKRLNDLIPEYFDSVPLDPKTAEPFNYTIADNRYYLGDIDAKATSGNNNGNGGPDSQGNGMSKDEESALIALLDSKEDEKFVYDPDGKIDPFRSFDFSPKDAGEAGETPLEQFNYRQLVLTAVLDGFDEPRAVVEDPEGKGHMVKVGMKIGVFGGKVLKIEKTKLVILETTVEFTGEKKTRTVELYLR